MQRVKNSPSDKYIHQYHQHHTAEQGVSSDALITVGVGLRDHLITDDIEHGASGKGQGKRQDGAGDAGGKVAHKGADDFHHAGEGSDEQGAALADTV